MIDLACKRIRKRRAISGAIVDVVASMTKLEVVEGNGTPGAEIFQVPGVCAIPHRGRPCLSCLIQCGLSCMQGTITPSALTAIFCDGHPHEVRQPRLGRRSFPASRAFSISSHILPSANGPRRLQCDRGIFCSTVKGFPWLTTALV